MRPSPSSHPIDHLLNRVARLPWWLGLALAAVSYAALRIAVAQPAVADWAGIAEALQYGLPLLCVAAAIVSITHRPKAHAPVAQTLSAREFETLIAEVFRMQGYQVVDTIGADAQADLVLRKDRGTFLVRCRQWKAARLEMGSVRELYGVLAARGAVGGFVVSSGRFSREAAVFAQSVNIKLIDGPVLEGLLVQAKARLAPAEPAPALAARAAVAEPTSPRERAMIPACPLCRKPMVRRTVKSGERAGLRFWGCKGHPNCKGTRPIAADDA